MRASWLVVAPVLICMAANIAMAADSDVAQGKHYFEQYCASCHGKDGVGDGPVAKVLSKRPANLRALGDKYGMPLPVAKIAAYIDGRDALSAHGTRDMPVWGERLYALGHGEKGEVGISAVVDKIVAYLDTIQDHRSASAEGRGLLLISAGRPD